MIRFSSPVVVHVSLFPSAECGANVIRRPHTHSLDGNIMDVRVRTFYGDGYSSNECGRICGRQLQ